MVWLTAFLTLAGVGLTVLSAKRRSGHVFFLALAGTLVAAFSFVSAASIGILLAPIAALLLAISSAQVFPGKPRNGETP